VVQKIAVSGKGGVGKTTLTGILARLIAQSGRAVIVVDADPDSNMASALGIPSEVSSRLTPLSAMYDLVEERTGMRPGTASGGVFKLNPQVDDLLDRYGLEGKDGVRLLVLGTIQGGGGGCFCPESTLLKRLMRHLILKREEVLLMDMEAGIEHLGRGTAENVEILLIVVEPGMRSLETASKIQRLGKDLGIREIVAVLNKVTDEGEVSLVQGELERYGIPLIATLPYEKRIGEADLRGVSPLDLIEGTPLIPPLLQLRDRLLS
jgi:CO dehydrogenase maturation factor